MKIFSAKQIKEADQQTLKNQHISSEELMERAGRLVFEEIDKTLNERHPSIKIFCGIGNNGGDGLVIGRLLIEKGYEVSVFIVNYSDNRSKDFLINYDRIKNVAEKWPETLKSEEDFPKIKPEDVVVDAIFGIGLNRPLIPWVGKLVEHMNKSAAYVFSVDMPSGMIADEPNKKLNAIVQANVTFSFQVPKLAFYLPETGKFVGKLKILDIGLEEEFLLKTPTNAQLVEKQDILKFYRARKKFSHKGTYGHALLVGGSYGKMGSICLSATAAMKSGAGMATVFAPKCGYNIVQTLLPEAMVITDETENHLSKIDVDFEPSVICFGVGVGQKEETRNAFEDLLEKTAKPMVIDADGLNLLSKNKNLLHKIPENSVLTPHQKELGRLIGSWENDFEKLENAQEFVKNYKLILVIKGAHSIIISEEKIYINSTGNPGMATAGSGDVLAGVITGLISQGYDPLTATISGVYLHGKAGDLAAEKLSFEGLIAGDISKNIGPAILELFESEGYN